MEELRKRMYTKVCTTRDFDLLLVDVIWSAPAIASIQILFFTRIKDSRDSIIRMLKVTKKYAFSKWGLCLLSSYTWTACRLFLWTMSTGWSSLTLTHYVLHWRIKWRYETCFLAPGIPLVIYMSGIWWRGLYDETVFGGAEVNFVFVLMCSLEAVWSGAVLQEAQNMPNVLKRLASMVSFCGLEQMNDIDVLVLVVRTTFHYKGCDH